MTAEPIPPTTIRIPIWVLPKARYETRIQVNIIHLEAEDIKDKWGKTGKRRKPVSVGY